MISIIVTARTKLKAIPSNLKGPSVVNSDYR